VFCSSAAVIKSGAISPRSGYHNVLFKVVMMTDKNYYYYVSFSEDSPTAAQIITTPKKIMRV
jgi:hypothetical protein